MDIRKIERLDQLIRGKRGNAKQLGSIMGLSERSVYKYIAFMKDELNAPIQYSAIANCYEYKEQGNIEIKFKRNEE